MIHRAKTQCLDYVIPRAFMALTRGLACDPEGACLTCNFDGSG
jgi:hypothetical protein